MNQYDSDIIARLTSADFPADPELDWKIIFHESIPPVTAKLGRVLDFEPREGYERNGFSLIFITELVSQYYPQGIYKLVHPKFGIIELFMVPVGPDKEGFIQYEIIFT